MKKSCFSLLFALTLGAASLCTAAGPLFPVVAGGRWGFIDKSGTTVINPQFDRADRFAHGLAPIKSGRWGYVDEAGKLAINPQFDRADPFSEGLAVIKLGGGPVSEPYAPYDPRPFDPFRGGGGGGRFGFITPDGKYVINPEFDDARGFSEGLAAVKMGHWGFIDKSGKTVINPQFDDTVRFPSRWRR